ncbi:MAG: hypothetical protein ACR2QB_11905 [Gammaproteobacteria bacterium]
MAGDPDPGMTQLFVTHLPYPGNPPTAHEAWPDDGILVETCLRHVWIGTMAPARKQPAGSETYVGIAAYQFLLEFISGLHSAIPGETNVLGQFRQTWFRWRASHPVQALKLAGIVEQLLQDARRIRARHLQGIGGISYGSLVRRLIQPTAEDRVLFVGAGELARSVWPFFRQFSTALWNHRPTETLSPEWLENFAPADGQKAARWARHIILTTPPDPSNDARWRRWLEAAAPESVTHLGHRTSRSFQIKSADRYHCLDDLFALRQSQDNVRSLQIEHARNACADHAANRYASGYSAANRARA